MKARKPRLHVDPDGLQAAVGVAISRLRRLMGDLQPPALERDGLASSIRAHLERFAADAGVEQPELHPLGHSENSEKCIPIPSSRACTARR